MSSIKSNQPLVVVTHQRDLPMLELLAKSLKHIDIEHPFYIIANDFKHVPITFYKERLLPLLNGREFVVINQADFGFIRSYLPEAGRLKYQQEGWINQQILKLAIAEILPSSVREYLVLDCQNFLVNPWQWPETAKTPNRSAKWFMHDEIWEKICDAYDYQLPFPEVSLCTPIFLNRQIVIDMINERGGLYTWSKWFISNGHLASEFACYAHWAMMNNRWESDHEEIEDWAIAYLRDSQTFDEDFDRFVYWFFDEVVKLRSWASINHRAWSQMNNAQYTYLESMLSKHGLDFDMSSLRKELVFE